MTKEEVAKVIKPGDHGSTFGGNPIACAAAIASLEVILEEDLLENTRITGTYLLNQLCDLAKKYSFIKEVRGVGFMIGIDFDSECRSIALRLMEQGLLVSCTALHVIRIVPPLILTREEADEIVAIMASVFEEIE